MAKTTYIIDRIEAGIAVLECQYTYEIIEIPKSELPKTAREGHVLTKMEGFFVIDREETQKRRDDLKRRLERILGREVK